MLVLITDEAWGLKADLAFDLPFPTDGQCLCLGSSYPAFTGCLNMFQVLINLLIRLPYRVLLYVFL